jgi:hypothetical protein
MSTELIDLLDVGFRGIVTGYRRIAALGNNPDVDILSVPEDVWSGSGLYPWMTGSTSLEIVSSSANDTAAGTGARTVQVQGLDTSHIELNQNITLNGTTAVAIPLPLFRINAGLIMSSGSGKTNAGDLTIRDAGGGTTRAIIPAGYGITKQSIFTVPAGFTLQIISQFFGFNSVTKDNRFAKFATFIQSPTGFYRLPLELATSDAFPYRHDGEPGLILPEKTDFCHRVTAVSDDNSNVTAAWLGVMRKN